MTKKLEEFVLKWLKFGTHLTLRITFKFLNET